MDRLANYTQDNDTELAQKFGEVDIYAMFKLNIDRLVDQASSLEFNKVNLILEVNHN